MFCSASASDPPTGSFVRTMYTHSLRPVLIGLTAESGTQEGLLTSAALPNPTQLKDTQGSGGGFRTQRLED